jgi:hypothetical protein
MWAAGRFEVRLEKDMWKEFGRASMDGKEKGRAEMGARSERRRGAAGGHELAGPPIPEEAVPASGR